MKKKALALAVAGAFFAPASYAAQDTSGMQYTSAAEGFYASIRARFTTESSKNGGAGIENSSSRFGVRGTNDLGGGLKGFYQYEAGVGIDDGGADGMLATRIGQVGLEGAFGRVWVGSGWTESHNMTYGATDIANSGSGNLSYGKVGKMRPGRASNMIQYRTPDISGFQGALGVNMKAGADNESYTVKDGDDSNVEMWSLAAKYGVQGFTGAFAYSVKPDSDVGTFMTAAQRTAFNTDRMERMAAIPMFTVDGTDIPSTPAVTDDFMAKQEDYKAWTARLGYAQDNWYVNGWYGKNNSSDLTATYTANRGEDGMPLLNTARNDVAPQEVVYKWEDHKFVSIAGGVSVGKVNMYAVWDQLDYGSAEDATTVIGVQYNLGSNSRVWMDFINQDLDSNANAEDHVKVGLQHNF